MSEPERKTETQAPADDLQILEKLRELNEGIHRAYCMATCVDYALLHKESDVDPEIAVCVREYLVHPLDTLSYAAADIRTALERTKSSAGMAATRPTTD